MYILDIHSTNYSLIVPFSIKALDLESSKNCFFDSLTIYDGVSNHSSRLLGPACGDLKQNTTDVSLT